MATNDDTTSSTAERRVAQYLWVAYNSGLSRTVCTLTEYDRIRGQYPAKNIVYALKYVHMYGSG
jgi:hypothetical protein